MKGLQVFDSEQFGQIRAVEIDGEPWLVGKDVAAVLGYKDTKSALLDHVDDEDRSILKSGDLPPLESNIPQGAFPSNIVLVDIPNRGLTIINESGLYSLVLSSKLPSAKQFRRWVTSEVLPSIRKNGGYIAGQGQMSDAELMARAVLVAQKTIEERDKQIRQLTATVEVQKQAIADFEPIRQYIDKILSSDRALTTTQIAADYDLSEYKLNVILRDARVQLKANGQWILYQDQMGKGYTKSKTLRITHSNGKEDVIVQTLWTQKGRLMIHGVLESRGIRAVMDRENGCECEEVGRNSCERSDT